MKFSFGTNLGRRELCAQLLHDLGMLPAGRAVGAVVVLYENGEGAGRAGGPLLGRRRAELIEIPS